MGFDRERYESRLDDVALGSCQCHSTRAELEVLAAGALALGTSHRVPSGDGTTETVDTLNNTKVPAAKTIPHPVLGHECNPKQGLKTQLVNWEFKNSYRLSTRYHAKNGYNYFW